MELLFLSLLLIVPFGCEGDTVSPPDDDFIVVSASSDEMDSGASGCAPGDSALLDDEDVVVVEVVELVTTGSFLEVDDDLDNPDAVVVVDVRE